MGRIYQGGYCGEVRFVMGSGLCDNRPMNPWLRTIEASLHAYVGGSGMSPIGSLRAFLLRPRLTRGDFWRDSCLLHSSDLSHAVCQLWHRDAPLPVRSTGILGNYPTGPGKHPGRPEDDLLFLESLDVLPPYRGHHAGLQAVWQLLDLFSAGCCGLLALATGVDHSAGGRLEGGGEDCHLDRGKCGAAYWARLGLAPLPRRPEVLWLPLSPDRVLPDYSVLDAADPLVME